MMVDNTLHEHRLCNGKCCRLVPEAPAPQAWRKKRPEAFGSRSFWYLVWGADYSHSIVAFGFGDMS